MNPCNRLDINTYHYPFGMIISGRNESADDYRYGFQGQENDDEIKGNGNSVNYKYRMHDPRIGRFFVTDPLESKYPHNSPYAFSENRVVDGIELEGLEVVTTSISAGAKAGAVVSAIRVSSSVGLAFDKYGNIALTMSGGLSIFFVENSIVGDGNVGTGDWTLGYGGGVEAKLGIAFEDHVTDIKGKGKDVDFGVGYLLKVGVTAQTNEEYDALTGFEISFGAGFGYNIGVESTNTSVISARPSEWGAVASDLYDYYTGEGKPALGEINLTAKDKNSYLVMKKGEGDNAEKYFITVVNSKGETLHTVDDVAFVSIGDDSFATEESLKTKKPDE